MPIQIWKLLSHGSDFRADATANVTTILAISIIPLIGAVGLAVDYGSANRSLANLQSALDGGVLAGAELRAHTANYNDKMKSSVEKAISEYVNAQFQTPDGKLATIQPTIDGSGGVEATASATIPNRIGGFFGSPSFTITAHSSATFGAGRAEVALVFDTTASMEGVKMTTAQGAAASLVDTLFATPNAAANVRMALAPFDVYVNVGLTYRGAPWLSNTADWSTTTNKCETKHPNAVYGPPVTTTKTCYRDGAPYSCTSTHRPLISEGPGVQVCGPDTSSYHWKGCVGSRNYPLDISDTVTSAEPVPGVSGSCSSPLVRLTSDASTLKAAIAGLTTDNETYIAPGLLWGWRLLSSNGPFGDGAPATTGAKKSIVLMTDGFNTHAPDYPKHDSKDTAAANNLTAQTCRNITAAGIAIFTVAFQVTDAAIKNVLADCASASSNYYDANSTGELTRAFSAIGSSLTAIRLSR